MPTTARGNLAPQTEELAAQGGLILDEWQRLVLQDWLGIRPDGKWAAFDCGLIVSRQNGKGSLLEARSLAGLFLFGEQRIVHSAHELKTAKEAYERFSALLEAAGLSRRIAKEYSSAGREEIKLKSGQSIVFMTRTAGGGRGLGGDVVILDEAMYLTSKQISAIMPVLSTRPNPQMIYTTSAPDRDIAPCEQITKVRTKALSTTAPAQRTAWAEWSAVFDERTGQMLEDPDDPAVWARNNPGMGIRISQEYVENEHGTLTDVDFARERLGVGRYPLIDDGKGAFPRHRWSAAEDPTDPAPEIVGRLCFGIAVAPDRSSSSIGMAGQREDGDWQIELTQDEIGRSDNRSGPPQWVVGRAKQIHTKTQAPFVIDARGPAASLQPELEAAGVPLIVIDTGELVQATASIFDSMTDETNPVPEVRHLGQYSLTNAVKGAQQRRVGDGFAWNRRDGSGLDVTPLDGVTLALHGARTHVTGPVQFIF